MKWYVKCSWPFKWQMIGFATMHIVPTLCPTCHATSLRLASGYQNWCL